MGSVNFLLYRNGPSDAALCKALMSNLVLLESSDQVTAVHMACYNEK